MFCSRSRRFLLLFAVVSIWSGPSFANQSPQTIDQNELLRSIQANQRTIDLARRNYICQMDQTGVVTDNKGKAKETVANTYEVFYLGGKQIRRQLTKDGKPLSPNERKREDDRIDKLYAEYRQKAANQSSPDSLKESDDRDEGILSIQNFLDVSRFVNPRVVRLQDKEMLAFDFVPRPDARPKNLHERLAKTLSGTVWIDPTAKQVTRLEATSGEDFKLDGGFLVSVHRGMLLLLEQECVHGEVWLPSYSEAHLSARALLFVRVKADVVARFSNYRKFSSTIEIKRP